YLSVAAGGAIGSLARWVVSLLAAGAMGSKFPYGTLIVNVLGSFVIGLYFTLTEPDGRYIAAPAPRQFVLAGFCGGFTTFSAFSLEMWLLISRSEWRLALVYVASSILLWFAGVWIGHAMGLRVNRLRGSRQ